VTGHHCVSAELSFVTAAGNTPGGPQEKFGYQTNLKIIPKTVEFIRQCPGPSAIAFMDWILPGDPGLFEGGMPIYPAVCKYFPKDPPRQDYTVVATPTTYQPPPFTTADGITQEQADALNAFNEAAFRSYALADAIVISADRMAGARQASGNIVSPYVNVQAQAMREFYLAYGEALHAGADALEALLDATQGAGVSDVSISVAAQQAVLEKVKIGGFPTALVQFYEDAGLSAEQIADLEDTYLTMIPPGDLQASTAYAAIADYSAFLREAGYKVFAALGGAAAPGAHLLPAQDRRIPVDRLATGFTVGNPTGSEATVELYVRPIDVPLGWSYGVDQPAPVLEAGETTTVTLFVDVPGEALAGSEAFLVVEGYIDGEFIGGIGFNPSFPDGKPEWGVFVPVVGQ
jgi:hypothetical protein